MIKSGVRDIAGRVRTLLLDSPIADVRHIRVECKGDQIQLHGRVRTFYAKQMAQETIRREFSDLHLVNSVNVD